MHVVVSGSTGLVGSHLVKRLIADGHQVTRLVRRTPRPGEVFWNPATSTIETAGLRGCDAVVHLAGAGIADHRWTDTYKGELSASRVQGTEVLAAALAGLDRPPQTLLSGSAIGYYGARGDEELDESSSAGSGFLADLCRDWERSTAAAANAGIRVAHLRTGIVLAADGGALRKQLPLFKLGLGGRMGSGQQWQSWISIDDEVGAIVHLLTSAVSGPVNLTAPNPVTQATFAKCLGKLLGRPTVIPTPSFAPKLLLGGELVDNVVLTGQRVLPAALLADGYHFRHEHLDDALRAVLGKPAAPAG